MLSLVTAMIFAAPIPGEAPIPPARPSIEIAIDPPGDLQRDKTGTCRSGSLSSGGESTSLVFCISGRPGADLSLSLIIAEANYYQVTSLIDRPEMVVALLSDRRFSDFWPVILHYGGEEGQAYVSTALKTRKKRASDIPRGPDAGDTAMSSLDGAGRKAYAEAVTLSQWGLIDEASAVLIKARPEPDRQGKLSSKQRFRLASLESRRAGMLLRAGRTEEALSVYSAIESDPRIGLPFSLNGKVNRAAVLAEMGRAEEALALIETANAEWHQALGDTSVEGSQRQFDWIRSCALHRLGRTKEAAQIIVGAFDKRVVSSGNFYIPTNESLETRYRTCIADRGWLVATLEKQLASPWPHFAIFGLLQAEGYESPFPGLADELRGRPAIQKELEQYREPPPGWRDLLDHDERTARARAIIAAESR